jgi:hypothetical protein
VLSGALAHGFEDSAGKADQGSTHESAADWVPRRVGTEGRPRWLPSRISARRQAGLPRSLGVGTDGSSPILRSAGVLLGRVQDPSDCCAAPRWPGGPQSFHLLARDRYRTAVAPRTRWPGAPSKPVNSGSPSGCSRRS